MVYYIFSSLINAFLNLHSHYLQMSEASSANKRGRIEDDDRPSLKLKSLS